MPGYIFSYNIRIYFELKRKCFTCYIENIALLLFTTPLSRIDHTFSNKHDLLIDTKSAEVGVLFAIETTNTAVCVVFSMELINYFLSVL